MKQTTPTKSTQDILCAVISTLQSNKVTANTDIASIGFMLLNPNKVRGVKRSLTVRRGNAVKAFNSKFGKKGKMTPAMRRKAARAMVSA